MDETPIRAVEMVRAIRDDLHERTKHMSGEEIVAFLREQAHLMRSESEQQFRRHVSGPPAA